MYRRGTLAVAVGVGVDVNDGRVATGREEERMPRRVVVVAQEPPRRTRRAAEDDMIMVCRRIAWRADRCRCGGGGRRQAEAVPRFGGRPLA